MATAYAIDLPGTLGNYASTPDTAANSLQGTLSALALSGHSGTYVSTPDSAALSIIGDIDIRVKATPDIWAKTGANQMLVASDVGDPNRRLRFYLNGAGGLSFSWYPLGTLASEITKTSTVATGFAAGTTNWVRVTLDVDNGAAGNDVKFYTSTDGVTWVQLGATVTTAGVTSIANTTSPYEIGTRFNGFVGDAFIGRIHYAEVRNGINGTVVANPDFTTTPWVIGDQASTARADTSGNTWTLNGFAEIVATAERRTLRIPGTAGNYASTPDTSAISLAGLNVLRLPGISGNYASTPDSVANSVTGDIDIRVKVALDDWTPSTPNSLVGKYTQTADQRSYLLQVSTVGRLLFHWSTAGTAGTTVNRTSTVATGLADGSVKWVRATLDVDNGAAGHDVKFYTSDDGATWVQLGTTVTTAGVTSIFDSTAVVSVGMQTNSDLLAGNVFYAEIRNGIAGTVVNKFDPSTISPTVDQVPTTLVSTTGETWTMNGTRWNWRRDNEVRSLRLSGASGVYASTPDSAALSIVGDIDLRAKVSMDDWTPSTPNSLVGKWAGTGNQRSYLLQVATNGTLLFYWSVDGTSNSSKNSTVVTGLADGSVKWVRVTLDVDNGAAGNDVKFYTSNDGVTWVQLGTTITTAGVTSIFDSTAVAAVGTQNNGQDLLTGNVYQIDIRNNILNDGTGIVANPSFENQPWDVGETSGATGTDAIGNTWTLNGAAIIRRAFNSDIDLRAKVTFDNWNTGVIQYILSTRVIAGLGYAMRLTTTGRLEIVWGDGSIDRFNSHVMPVLANGATKWVRITMDADNGAAGSTFNGYTSDDGTTWTLLAGSPNTTTPVTQIGDGGALEVGSGFTGATTPMAGHLHYAEVRNGIDGTIVANPNFTARPWDVGETGGATGADTLGNVWTLNGTAIIQRAFASDFDIRVKLSMDDWTPATQSTYLMKYTSGNNRSYRFLNNGTNLELGISYSGLASGLIAANASLATGFIDGTVHWVRSTWRVSDGRVQFFISDDGTNWTQLGVDRTIAIFGVYDGTAEVDLGGGTNEPLAGNFYYADVRNGIDPGVIVVVFNPAEVEVVGVRNPSVFTTSGTTWTMSGSEWNWLVADAPPPPESGCGGGYGGTFYAEVEYAGTSSCAEGENPPGTPPGPTSNIEEVCRTSCGPTAI